MFEPGVVTHFGSGLGGGLVVAVASFYVLREKIDGLKTRQDSAANRLNCHDQEIDDIKARKHCGPCDQLTIERRRHDNLRTEQLKESMAELKTEMACVKKTVETCFQDMIIELRK